MALPRFTNVKKLEGSGQSFDNYLRQIHLLYPNIPDLYDVYIDKVDTFWRDEFMRFMGLTEDDYLYNELSDAFNAAFNKASDLQSFILDIFSTIFVDGQAFLLDEPGLNEYGIESPGAYSFALYHRFINNVLEKSEALIQEIEKNTDLTESKYNQFTSNAYLSYQLAMKTYHKNGYDNKLIDMCNDKYDLSTQESLHDELAYNFHTTYYDLLQKTLVQMSFRINEIMPLLVYMSSYAKDNNVIIDDLAQIRYSYDSFFNTIESLLTSKDVFNNDTLGSVFNDWTLNNNFIDAIQYMHEQTLHKTGSILSNADRLTGSQLTKFYQLYANSIKIPMNYISKIAYRKKFNTVSNSYQNVQFIDFYQSVANTFDSINTTGLCNMSASDQVNKVRTLLFMLFQSSMYDGVSSNNTDFLQAFIQQDGFMQTVGFLSSAYPQMIDYFQQCIDRVRPPS